MKTPLVVIPTGITITIVNLLVILIVLMLLFGGGGFYLGGPMIGGGGFGLILLICLVLFSPVTWAEGKMRIDLPNDRNYLSAATA